MALKDWKKVGSNQWTKKKWSGYFNDNPDMVEVNTYSKTGNNTDKNKTYAVSVWTNTEIILLEKKFKTKFQALKFAKSYMRKH